MTTQQIKQRLWLVRIIMVMLSWNLAMPVITTFWASLHMNAEQIGRSQMVFTFVMIAFNILTGRWADRHGRRSAMLIGLVITGLSFVAYARATNLWWVIAMEVTTGIGMAFASGSDTSLHRHYCDELGINLTRDRTYIAATGACVAAIAMLIGGWLGSLDLRLTMALTGVPFLLAIVLATRLQEVHERPRTRTKLLDVLRDIHANRQLRWTIVANSLAREITHAPIWVFTPLMLANGVPARIVGVGWALQYCIQIPGGALARLAHRRHLAPSATFASGMMATLCACIVVCLWPNAVTVVASFVVFGLMRSWTSSLISPLVTEAANPLHVTTTESAADTVSRILYAFMVWFCGWASNTNPIYTLVVTAVVFTVPAIVTTLKLRREE